MSEKILKISRKAGQKAFRSSTRTAALNYVDTLCRQPFLVRLAFAWRFIRGRNPHTGKEVK